METYRSPEIRSSFSQIDILFLANWVRSIDDTPYAFLFTDFHQFFPWHQHPRIWNYAIDDSHAFLPFVLCESFDMISEQISNLFRFEWEWELDFRYKGMGELVLEAIHSFVDGIVACVNCKGTLNTLCIGPWRDIDTQQMIMSSFSHSKFRKIVLIATEALGTRTISSHFTLTISASCPRTSLRYCR